MSSLLFMATVLALLPVAMARPFVGILLWSWLSFMNPHQVTLGPAAGYPWAAMAFAATLVGCLVAREPRRPPLDAVTVLLSIFLACITITSFTALSWPDAVWRMWDRTFKMILGLVLTAALLTDRRRIHALVWIMVISVGYFGVRGGLFTLSTGGRFIVLGPRDTMITDRNHLAVALLVAIPLMNYLRLQSPHRPVQWGLIGAMALSLFSVVGSQSRGALVALVASAGVLWIRSSGKVVSGIAIILALSGVITFMPDSWVERMNTMNSYQEDGSAMGRITIWQAAYDVAVARPLVGGGFRAVYNQEIVDRFSPGIRARATHSIWFETLGEHGFPTFFVWLGIILAGVWYTMRIKTLTVARPDQRWAYDLARMAQVSIIAYAVGGTFLSLSYWDFFWTLLVVLGATHTVIARSAATADAGLRAAPAMGLRSASASYS